MGGSQSSPRNITLENPDEPSVIKITDTVVERLQQKSSASEPPSEKPKSDTSHGASQSYHDAGPASSHQFRKEVDKEIEKNNARWETRLRVLQEGYREVNAELEHEYMKAVKEVNQTLGKQFVSKDLPDTCHESQNDVIQCYNLNRDQSLLCSKEVEKFNNCVSSRMNTMMKAK